MSAKRILLAQLGANGDCLYATVLARQIKHDHPDCHLTWAVARQCRPILEGNPHVDEVWEWDVPPPARERAWAALETAVLHIQSGPAPYDQICMSQIWPLNYRRYDGTIRPSILRAWPGGITVPVDSVIMLSDQERERVAAFARRHALEQRAHVILFECSSNSGQSYVSPAFAQDVARRVAAELDDCLFILSTSEPIDSDLPMVVSAQELGIREHAELTRYCSVFVGCGSGLTVAATADAAHELPNIQLLSGHTSVYASFHHDFEYWNKPTGRFVEMGDASAEKTAAAIVACCRRGLEAARGEFHRPLPVTFGFYFDQIDRWLLRFDHRYVDALESLGVTAGRYGWDESLLEFGRSTLLPHLARDPRWMDPRTRTRLEPIADRLLSDSHRAAPPPAPTAGESRIALELAPWAGSPQPLRLEIEPEFGLAGYGGIVERELTQLDALIDQHGVAESGGRFVPPPPAAPVVARLLPDRVSTGYPGNTKPCWGERYQPQQSHAHLQAGGPPPVPGAYGDSPSLRQSLGRILQNVERLAFLADDWWRHCGAVVKDVAPALACEWLSWSRPEVELGDSVRIPLRRVHPFSLAGWARLQAEQFPASGLLVVEARAAQSAFEKLRGRLHPEQRVLIVPPGDAGEAGVGWRRTEPCADGLVLLQGPPAELVRPPEPAPPRNGWPRISVVTISYNQRAFLQECLDSVLAQGYPNLEYIVIDGGSTDGSAALLERYRPRLARLVIEADDGQSDALNKGLALATGEVLTWLCSDDRLEPGALFHVGRTFAENQVDLVAGGCRVIDAEGRTSWLHHCGLPLEVPTELSFGDILSFTGVWQRGMYFFQPETFFSRALWQAAGGYVKPHLHFAMDYDLFLRFAMAGARILHIPRYLAASRQHAEQKTRHDTMLYLPTVRAVLREYDGLLTAAATAIEGTRP